MTSLVRLHQGIQGQNVNSDADKLLVKPFCFLYSEKIIQSIKNKFNTRRKLTISIFINRLPQSRLTTVKRVRACERAAKVWLKLAICTSPTQKETTLCWIYVFFPTKVQKICIWSFILYFMKCYPSDFRAPPTLERNAHFRKLHFFMEKCLFVLCTQVRLSGWYNVSIWVAIHK